MGRPYKQELLDRIDELEAINARLEKDIRTLAYSDAREAAFAIVEMFEDELDMPSHQDGCQCHWHMARRKVLRRLAGL